MTQHTAAGEGNSLLATRLRLVSLWLSQLALSLAVSCLVSLYLSGPGPDGGTFAIVAITFFLAPSLLLAPVNGALSNSLPKRWVLVGSSALCFGMIALADEAATQGTLGLRCLTVGLLGAGHALYHSVRYALLPAAAQDVRCPLNRVMGWMECPNYLGPVAGLLLALSLSDQVSVALATVAGFSLVAVLCALPVHFRSDVRRPEPPAQALAGFFRDCKLLGRDRAARGSLLGLAYFQVLIVAGSFTGLHADVADAGLALGCLLAAVQGHPRRMLGLVPPAAVGLVAALGLVAAQVGTLLGTNLLWATWILLGLMGALILVPLRTNYQLATPADRRGNGMALLNAVNALSTLVPVLVPALVQFEWTSARWAAYFCVLVIMAAAGALVAWRLLLRDALELVGEIVLWPMYHVRTYGPGRFEVPLRGPVLVIANHASWFDPLWLAKVLPRSVTPMMTSAFFDLPVLHWLMSKVAGAIRVPAAAFRRDAPELEEAVAVLDRGGCLLIFPEGAMRRSAEQSLRHFGQGVWRILRQRPETPVVVCWIEGGWGCFASYCGGPPAVNKRLDWRRPIRIAVEAPQVLDAALLADQQASRTYLMQACLHARRHLGLEPLPLPPRASEPASITGQYEQAS